MNMISTASATATAAAAAAAVAIGSVRVPIAEVDGMRVVTLDMIDKVHERPAGTAGRNFRRNRSRLSEGEDFIEVSRPDEIRRLELARLDGSTRDKMLLITETGYLMLVKSFRDDLAWQVQRKLVSAYFRTQVMPMMMLPRPRRRRSWGACSLQLWRTSWRA